MGATFLGSTESLMHGLRFGGLMNESLSNEETFRTGRHHVMTALNQIMQWTLALEQFSKCLQAANITLSFKVLDVAKVVVPLGVAYLASRQIKVLHISEIANFVQGKLGVLSLVVMAASSVALFVLGQTVVATVTLAYLTLGLLDRYNVLPESVQHVVHHANKIIGNLAGIYFGGNFIRFMCTMNLVITVIEHYFDYQRHKIEKEQEMHVLLVEDEDVDDKDLIGEHKEVEEKREVSLDQLQQLQDDSECALCLEHIHKTPLPPVREDVKIDDILDLYEQIDWSRHEHVVKKKLAKDKRWLEVGQFETTPLKYFDRNLHAIVESIRDRKILQGKPQNYEMLEYYCRFIAQELKEQDEITQADFLILLGVEGGEYCGTGKFGIVEEIYENLVAQAAGLPLETRVWACLQQERKRVWQHIYELVWTTNPFTQFFGYMTDVNAVHNANLFMNLIQAGPKFGLSHQAAKNDQTATINPITHYLAFVWVQVIENSFWKGTPIVQCYVNIDRPEGRDQWKIWKWAHLKIEKVAPVPYDQHSAMQRFKETIGTPQIPTTDIYAWWNAWIERQPLEEEEKESLTAELTLTASLNGEPLEVNGKLRPKFLKAMLIEMGVLKHPIDQELILDEEVTIS